MIIPESLIDAFHHEDDHEAVALVIADWLDEHDHTNEARFVRLAVALQQQPDHPEREDWRDTAERLRLAHPNREFWGRLPAADAGLCGLPRIDRDIDLGMVDFSNSLERGIAVNDEQVPILLMQPWIKRLAHLEISARGEIADKFPSLQFIHSDQLRLRSLTLPRLTRSLVGTPLSMTLESLATELTSSLVEQSILREIGEAGNFPRLRELTLFCGGTESLNCSERDPRAWAPLRSLRVCNHPVEPAAMAFLGRWLSNAPIQKFGFVDSRWERNADAFDAFFEAAESTPHLRELDFAGSTISLDTLERLSRWPGLATIRTLRWGIAGILDDGIADLAHSEYAVNLRELDVQSGISTPFGIAELCESPLAGRLQSLAIDSDLELPAEDWRDVLHLMAKHCPSLRRLKLGHLGTQDSLLPMNLHWPGLQELSLSHVGQYDMLWPLLDQPGLAGLWHIHFALTWGWERGRRGTETFATPPANWFWATDQDLVRMQDASP